jgi:peptidoglycan/LPS O-acetylase OafA/YrhL
MKPPSRSRYGFIDAIRGIAACAVMLQHSLYESGLLGGPASAHLTGFIPNWLELGETGVVAFFIVSGFVIPLSLEKTANFKLFWIHRALRIYPLYIVTFAVTFLMERGGDIQSVAAFCANALAHLFFVQEYLKQQNFVGGSWTLSLEMIWYIAISILAVLSLNKKTVSLVVAGLLLSFLADAACASGHHLPMGRLSMLLCCVLGLVFYRRDAGHLSGRSFTCLSFALVAAIALNLFLGFGLFPGSHPTATFRTVACSWSLAAFVFIMPFLTRRATIWSHPAFGFLGRHSYSIYLLHPIVLFMLTSGHVAGAFLIAVTFVVTIAVATLTYRFIEAPPIRVGHRLRPKPQPFAGPLAEGDVAAVRMVTRTP